MGTIVNLAQNFVGSNNVNLLQPRGQFGTRLHGGRDAASPRYIFTLLRYAHSRACSCMLTFLAHSTGFISKIAFQIVYRIFL